MRADPAQAAQSSLEWAEGWWGGGGGRLSLVSGLPRRPRKAMKEEGVVQTGEAEQGRLQGSSAAPRPEQEGETKAGGGGRSSRPRQQAPSAGEGEALSWLVSPARAALGKEGLHLHLLVGKLSSENMPRPPTRQQIPRQSPGRGHCLGEPRAGTFFRPKKQQKTISYLRVGRATFIYRPLLPTEAPRE